MALEVLNGVEEIGGFSVDHSCSASNESPIAIDAISNEITFRIQNGPIKEVGVNGCQVVTMIQTARLIIEKLNDKYLCWENAHTIESLDKAISYQENRTKNRESRGVEGTSNA